MADITFNCPTCSHELVVDASGEGKDVSCPRCGSAITIPRQTKQCPECLANIPFRARKCMACGSDQVIAPHPSAKIVKAYAAKREAKDRGFFDGLVTPAAISLLWVAGMIIFTLGGLFYIVAGVMDSRYEAIVGGVVGICMGNIFWRIACEMFLIVFKIHDELKAIRAALSEK